MSVYGLHFKDIKHWEVISLLSIIIFPESSNHICRALGCPLFKNYTCVNMKQRMHEKYDIPHFLRDAHSFKKMDWLSYVKYHDVQKFYSQRFKNTVNI